METIRVIYINTNENAEKETPITITSYDECQWKSFERIVGQETNQPFIDDVDTGGLGSNADN